MDNYDLLSQIENIENFNNKLNLYTEKPLSYNELIHKQLEVLKELEYPEDFVNHISDRNITDKDKYDIIKWCDKNKPLIRELLKMERGIGYYRMNTSLGIILAGIWSLLTAPIGLFLVVSFSKAGIVYLSCSLFILLIGLISSWINAYFNNKKDKLQKEEMIKLDKILYGLSEFTKTKKFKKMNSSDKTLVEKTAMMISNIRMNSDYDNINDMRGNYLSRPYERSMTKYVPYEPNDNTYDDYFSDDE